MATFYLKWKSSVFGLRWPDNNKQFEDIASVEKLTHHLYLLWDCLNMKLNYTVSVATQMVKQTSSKEHLQHLKKPPKIGIINS